MLTVRKNTFETNSSSTHSLCISQGDSIDHHITELDNILYEIESKEDLCEALYHVRELERLILEGIRELEGD